MNAEQAIQWANYLAQSVAQDPGQPFQEPAIEAAAFLKGSNPAEYQRLRAAIAASKARVGDWDERVCRRLREAAT